MERDASVRAATLLAIVRLWSEDAARDCYLSRGEVAHAWAVERQAIRTFEALVALIAQWNQDDLAARGRQD